MGNHWNSEEWFCENSFNHSKKSRIIQNYFQCSKDLLRSLNNRKGKGHVDFKRRLATTDKIASGLEVVLQDNGNRVIYTGHHAYLRDRCRNHFDGYDGTGCLNLFELKDFDHYFWTFEFFDLRRVEDYEDSIITRTALGQYYRSQIGWPILCDR